MITFHADLLSVLTLLTGTVLPVLVGLVTNDLSGSRFQAILLAVLSAVTAAVSQWIEFINHGGQYNIWQVATTFIITFVVAAATHYGLWRPTGVKAWAMTHGVARKQPVAIKHGEHEAP